MFKQRFTRTFRQLRGKLTLSYTITAVLSFLFFEILFFSIVFFYVSSNAPMFSEYYLKQYAPQAAPYFTNGSVDREGLAIWLRLITAEVPQQWPLSNDKPQFLAVVDTHEYTLVSTGTQSVPSNEPIQAQLQPQDQANLAAVLNRATGEVRQHTDGTIIAMAPIRTNGNQVQGALIMTIAQPDRGQQLASIFQFILLTSALITIVAAIIGIISGSLIARGITRRLKQLSVAADRWSRGDFSALAPDTSVDELGQTAHQLNQMAGQLRNLLQVRQKLATLEERNRLARDLHDSVKQQVFAVGMQIGATKVLLKRDIDAAEARLLEAQKLVGQAQQELTTLIRELRPVALEGKGLAAALRELATQWTQQTGIVANVSVEGTQPLPLTVEEALFRVAQEALANANRHSKATLVQITLIVTDEMVTLAVADNGQGFDSARREGRGVGLLSMQERMKALSGDVLIESKPGAGTRIAAHCKRLGTGTGAAMRGEDTPAMVDT